MVEYIFRRRMSLNTNRILEFGSHIGYQDAIILHCSIPNHKW